MKKSAAFLVISTFLCASFAAKAEPIPDYVLQKDYENCMGGESEQKDPDRSAYCKCVGDSMREWDIEAYAKIALEAKASGQQIPAQVEEIGKACMERILK